MKLISVKGLGPKTALNMLAKSSTNHLINVIETGDVKALKNVPGIGNKTASQIILDLKGKLISSEEGNEKYNMQIEDALEALKNLGYKQAELNQAAKVMNKEAGLKTEQYLKIGLQFLNGRK